MGISQKRKSLEVYLVMNNLKVLLPTTEPPLEQGTD